MKPASPVVEGYEKYEIVVAKNQEPYLPLPVLSSEDGDCLTSRWTLTLWERIVLLLTGELWLHVYIFKRPLQPVQFTLRPPRIEEPK